jgi:hypothetical protein
MTPLDPFVTVQDLSDRLGRDVTTDPGAISAVDSACQICRSEAEQDFNAGTAIVTLDGTGSDALILAQRPVGTVTSVVVNGGTVTDWTLAETGMLFRGTAGASSWTRPVWPQGRQNVQVTYTHGYATLTVPADVCEVALQLAMRCVVQGAAQQETVGDVTVNYGMSADDLTKNEQRILQRYRGPRSF